MKELWERRKLSDYEVRFSEIPARNAFREPWYHFSIVSRRKCFCFKKTSTSPLFFSFPPNLRLYLYTHPLHKDSPALPSSNTMSQQHCLAIRAPSNPLQEDPDIEENITYHITPARLISHNQLVRCSVLFTNSYGSWNETAPIVHGKKARARK